MNAFFCSDHSRELGEDIIGSATNYETYILVECPPPWMPEAFNSKWVPENLQILADEIKHSKLPIRLLLIANNSSHKTNQTTLLIYHKNQGYNNGYEKQEFQLSNIEQAAGVIKKWLVGASPDSRVHNGITRDILVCTHGSHDRCCARYGNPFYVQAASTISDLCLDNVRVWKSSHFGGHRFAPTAIDLPEGRYYGALEPESFKSILTRTGDIQCFNKIYRGWGILPNAIQAVERELILLNGWDWLNYKVSGEIIQQSADKNVIHAEIAVKKTDGSSEIYQAKLIKNEDKIIEMIGSCNAKKKSVFVKYTVASLWQLPQKVVSYST